MIIKNDTMATVLNTLGLQIEIDVPEEDYEKALHILKESFPDLGY